MAGLIQRVRHMTDLLPEADLMRLTATMARGELKLSASGGRGSAGKMEQQVS